MTCPSPGESLHARKGSTQRPAGTTASWPHEMGSAQARFSCLASSAPAVRTLDDPDLARMLSVRRDGTHHSVGTLDRHDLVACSTAKWKELCRVLHDETEENIAMHGAGNAFVTVQHDGASMSSTNDHYTGAAAPHMLF